MNCNNGEKNYMQIETNINGQDVKIIKVGIEPTADNFKKKIELERTFKYDAIAEPIKNNIYPIERYRGNQQGKQTRKTFRK